jgi:hypothetical protein
MHVDMVFLRQSKRWNYREGSAKIGAAMGRRPITRVQAQRGRVAFLSCECAPLQTAMQQQILVDMQTFRQIECNSVFLTWLDGETQMLLKQVWAGVSNDI